jgi:hypothetical protein
VLDAERIEERTHHRALRFEVIHDQQSRSHQLRDRGHRHQMPRLLLRRQRDDALGTELQTLGDGRHRVGMFGRGVLVAPECLGGLLLPFGRELFPELRRSRDGRNVGHGQSIR